jgi:hypothetical protein
MVALTPAKGLQWQEDLEAAGSEEVWGVPEPRAVIYSNPVLYGETVYIGEVTGDYLPLTQRPAIKNVTLNATSPGSISGIHWFDNDSCLCGSTDVTFLNLLRLSYI